MRHICITILFKVTICLILASCNQLDNSIISEKNHLEIAQKYYGFADNSYWVPILIIADEDFKVPDDTLLYSGGYYSYKKALGDSIFWLYFQSYACESDTIFIPMEFYQRFEKENFQHIILFGENMDTLFYYKAEMFGALTKIFIRGKYHYQYMFGELAQNHQRYYLEHFDSLHKIRGHNLPALPDY